jgi:hypothetical protein
VHPVEHDDPGALFERAAHAVAFGDLATLCELLDEEPALVHARSPRTHRATLLHYCAANGTESPRQRTPPNAPAIASLLLDRGTGTNATTAASRIRQTLSAGRTELVLRRRGDFGVHLQEHGGRRRRRPKP